MNRHLASGKAVAIDLFASLGRLQNTSIIADTTRINMELSINPALDLEYIERVYGDDPNIISSIFHAFLDDCLPRWNSLAELIVEQNKKAAASVVHGLKPAFTMAGLGPIKIKVVALEQLILNDADKESQLALYDEINLQMDVMVPILTEEAARLGQLAQ